MTWVEIEPPFQPLFSRSGWNSFDEVVAHFAGGSAREHKVLVRPVTISNPAGADRNVIGERRLDVYFKQYRFAPPSWRFWRRASKARREFDNYGALAALGIPVAQRVAVGEKRDALGRLHSAFIITRAVPDSRTLVEFAARRPKEAVRRQLTNELAELTRRLHEAGFFYHDLVWRNILVSGQDDPRLVLIDCPRGAFARFGQRRNQLRDLASLDKSAAAHCRRSERWRFLVRYAGEGAAHEQARRLARACQDYRRRRWPEDWRGK